MCRQLRRRWHHPGRTTWCRRRERPDSSFVLSSWRRLTRRKHTHVCNRHFQRCVGPRVVEARSLHAFTRNKTAGRALLEPKSVLLFSSRVGERAGWTSVCGNSGIRGVPSTEGDILRVTSVGQGGHPG